MHIKFSWTSRVNKIIHALDAITCETLGRSDVEALFGVQRRAALRIMEKLNPKLCKGGEWLIERLELQEWLHRTAEEIGRDSQRSKDVRRAIGRAELENRQLRDELKKRGHLNTPVWTVAPSVFERRVQDLPENIELRTGTITVVFAPQDPRSGAQLLHELSLAMLSDWQGFCAKVGSQTEQSKDEAIQTMLRELELTRMSGLE